MSKTYIEKRSAMRTIDTVISMAESLVETLRETRQILDSVETIELDVESETDE